MSTTRVIETTKLSGPSLNWATAMAHLKGQAPADWDPVHSWRDAGSLYDAHIRKIGESMRPLNGWGIGGRQHFALTHNNTMATGPTVLVAICRAVLLELEGTAIEIPAELAPDDEELREKDYTVFPPF